MHCDYSLEQSIVPDVIVHYFIGSKDLEGVPVNRSSGVNFGQGLGDRLEWNLKNSHCLLLRLKFSISSTQGEGCQQNKSTSVLQFRKVSEQAEGVEDDNGSVKSCAFFTLETLASTANGVTSPTTVSFFAAKSISNDVTPNKNCIG